MEFCLVKNTDKNFKLKRSKKDRLLILRVKEK